MAISLSLLTENEGTASSGVCTTASVSLAANKLQLVCVTLRGVTDPADNSVSLSGHSRTWTRLGHAGDPNRAGTWFRSMGGASGSAAITITGPSDTISMTWAVVEVDGVKTTGTNGADAITDVAEAGGSTDPQPSVTCAGSPSAGDVTFGFCMTEDAQSGLTEEAGWTLLTELIGTIETSHSIIYDTDQDLTPSWSGIATNNRDWGAFVGILRAPTSGLRRKGSLGLCGVGR
jgi:hypothetical protein